MSLQAHLCWSLLFMKSHGSMAPIGALDYRKMKSCEYFRVFFYSCDEEEEAIFCFGFLLWFFNGSVIWWLGKNVLPHCQVFFSKK